MTRELAERITTRFFRELREQGVKVNPLHGDIQHFADLVADEMAEYQREMDRRAADIRRTRGGG